MFQPVWQIPLFTLGIYIFCRGAKLVFCHRVCNILEAAAAVVHGNAEVTRIEQPWSWRGRLLYHAVVLVAAVYLWTFL